MYKTINDILINVNIKIRLNDLKNKKYSPFNTLNLNLFSKDLKKKQKIIYLKKLNEDKKYFYMQHYFKILGKDVKIIKSLLFLQKKIQFFAPLIKKKNNKLLLDFDVDSFLSIKNQLFKAFLFKQNVNSVDIFPTEDIFFHVNIIKLLSVATVKGIFDLYSKVSSLNSLNKFSFIVYYETFDGNSNSSAFPSSFILTKDDISFLENLYLNPEKVSFFSSIFGFILYLTEKYEGTSFYKVSVINTCVKWSHLKKAFNSKK